MPLIPEHIIEQVRQSVDIVEIISDHVILAKRGRSFLGLCPFHDDHSPSFNVSQDKQIYKCFVCGAGGNIFKFLMETERISFVEAVRKLAEKEELAIIMCGRQTIDGDTAQVGPGIATRLGCSQLTLVDRIEEVDLESKIVKARRKLEGRHEIVAAPLPAMIAVLREINSPRYPNVPMRLMAEDASITLWDNKIMQMAEEYIGLKGSATQVRKIFSPERAKGEILGSESDQPEDSASLLINRMLEKDLLSL